MKTYTTNNSGKGLLAHMQQTEQAHETERQNLKIQRQSTSFVMTENRAWQR